MQAEYTRDYFTSAGRRIWPDQFRNQHFRAEFSISYLEAQSYQLKKMGSGSYSFLRRHYMHQCASSFGVDVACLAMKAHGLIKRGSDSYKIKYHALTDQLEHYDDVGLAGIRDAIKGV